MSVGGGSVGGFRPTEGVSPGDSYSLGLDVGVQLLWKEVDADEAYVSGRAWERAILSECPFHPGGGCGVERLGSYPRVWPEGCRIARFWCPVARASISLLPESLAAGVTGSLDAIEAVVDSVEAHGVAGAVEVVFPVDGEKFVGTTTATRSLRRRVRWVRSLLLAVVTLLADRFVGIAPTLESLRAALRVERVLVALRRLPELDLLSIARPLGFRARENG